MNTGRPKGNQKHLDLSARIIIEQHLNNGDSFRSIAIELSKDPSTISKEIRRHSIIRERSADAFAPIPCANNYDSSKPRTNICNVMHMCGDNECRRKCVLCRKFRCSDVCKFYKPRECEKLNKPPYVCNGCSKRTNCMMEKKIYSSKYAQDSYETLRTTSREGINQTPESIQKLDNLLSPLLKKGQSIAHIYASHADEIACSRRTIYSYSLNAGRYVGVVIEDDGLTQEEFKEEMYSLNAEFTALSTEAKTLEELIANNLKGLLGE